MERYLESKGKLKAFYASYEKYTGLNWVQERDAYQFNRDEIVKALWPAPGSEDTELGALMELEVGHGEASVYAGVQA